MAEIASGCPAPAASSSPLSLAPARHPPTIAHGGSGDGKRQDAVDAERDTDPEGATVGIEAHKEDAV